MGVITNPDIDCLGHPGNPLYPCDYEKIVKACAENGKVVEVNSQSFKVRKGSDRNCRIIAELCIKYGVQMALNSDGHFMSYVGNVKPSIDLLEDLHCPEELVINSSWERLRDYFLKRRGLDIDL
jgi:putative hydrolase